MAEFNKKSKLGFIVLWRSFISWEWFTDINTCHLFQYCLLRANHVATKWRGISLERGQFITSLEKLSVATGLTIQQIRTALKHLKITGEVTCKTTSRYSIITVNNYSLYQDKNIQTDKQTANEQQTNNNR